MKELQIFDQIDGISRDELVERMSSMPQTEMKLDHCFTEGLYTRTLNIPAGNLIIGKRHKHKTLNILMQGEIAIYLDDGQKAKIMKAPHVFESEAGVSKIGYAITDSVWANVHITEETDLEKIEEEFIIPEQEYQLEETPCLG